MKNLFKGFLAFLMIALTAPAFAADVSVDYVLRPGLTTNFDTDQTNMDFNLSYVTLKKDFTDNLTATVTPGFARRGDAVNDTIDTLDLYVLEANFMVNDVTKGCGDYGIYVMAGQRLNPFYHLEEKYYGGNYYKAGLHHSYIQNRLMELGVATGGTFFDNMLDVSLAVNTGSPWTGEFFVSPLNDTVNAMAAHLFVAFRPFEGKDYGDLSIAVNWEAAGRHDALSDIAFHIGYAYEGLLAYVEWLTTYSRTAALNQNTAFSFGASYDVLEGDYITVGPLVRYDYIDTAGVWRNELDAGLYAKWFDGKLKTAVTFDGDKVQNGNWGKGMNISAQVAI